MTNAKQTMIEGDSLVVLPTLPRASFDLLLTDPPYAMPAQFYEGRTFKRRWSDSSILTSWWRGVVGATMPLLKPNAMIAVFANANAVAAFWPVLFEVTTTLQLAVWDKGSLGMGSPLRVQTEFIIVGAVGKSWQRDRATSNVFSADRVHPSERVHLAQKPDLLIAELLQFLCPQDGNVLDPFAGSGVVRDVCAKLGYRSTSIEYDMSDTLAETVDLFA